MSLASRRLALASGLVAAFAAAVAAGQTQPIYRYVDAQGSIAYSDKPPPPDAKKVEAMRLNLNTIETDQTALEAQRAQDRYPVTLYTFACGDVCDRAEALLNRRGVPFTRVNVSEADNQEKLKRLTGELRAPVLQAGDKLVIKGFSETEWQALLDRAGYPKTPPLRRTPIAPEAAKAAARAPATEPAAGGGYPKD